VDREIKITVGSRLAGLRLDRGLHVLAPTFSRTFWTRVVRGRQVRVNGQGARASRVLSEGDQVAFWLSDLGLSELLLFPEELAAPLYQDSLLVALDKPAGLLTHPAGRVVLRSATVLASLKLEEELFPVHRLDKYTSGLLLLARSADSARLFGERLARRTVKKTYLALSRFQPAEDHFSVNLALEQTGEEHVKLKMLPYPAGKPALTEFFVRERYPEGCLIECRPHTGRQHQIRAHLLSVEAPIVGDLLYGPEEDWSYFDDLSERKHATPDGRWHGLHAWKLEVPDWSSEGDLSLEAPPQGAFAETLRCWQQD
jgi:23S rRNA pseudouridine1911/1915/1917 synthase